MKDWEKLGKRPYNIVLDKDLVDRVRATKVDGISVKLTAVIDALLREWLKGKERNDGQDPNRQA